MSNDRDSQVKELLKTIEKQRSDLREQSETIEQLEKKVCDLKSYNVNIDEKYKSLR